MSKGHDFLGGSSQERWRRISCEPVVLDRSIGLSLGSQELVIAKLERDISPELTERFSPEVEYCILDPAQLDESLTIGFKGLWEGEDVILGRQYDYGGRFEFELTVSRQHVKLRREGDVVIVTDLDSTNGTSIKLFPRESIHTKNPRKIPRLGTLRQMPHEDQTPRSPDKERKGQKVFGVTVASERHPNRNEDNYFVDSDAQAGGVFDGVGGAAGSELASQIAAAEVARQIREIPTQLGNSLSSQVLKEVILHAHDAVNQQSGSIATTVTIAKLFENDSGSKYAAIANCGDSRAYLFRAGHLEHITLDHAFIGGLDEAERRGLQDTLSQATDLSGLDEEARTAFYNRNIITSHLGGKVTPTIDVSSFEVLPEDLVLLTSDGIHDNLTTDEINKIVGACAKSSDIPEQLLQAAQKRSRDYDHSRAKADDMTAVVLNCS